MDFHGFPLDFHGFLTEKFLGNPYLPQFLLSNQRELCLVVKSVLGQKKIVKSNKSFSGLKTFLTDQRPKNSDSVGPVGPEMVSFPRGVSRVPAKVVARWWAPYPDPN